MLLRRRSILFSDKYGWATHIRKRLNPLRYTPTFSSFQTADLDAYDLLIPQHIRNIRLINEQRPDLRGARCFTPPSAALECCNDKLAFNRFMQDINRASLIPDIDDALTFPYILKKRIDENGVHSRIIHNRQEEAPFRQFLDSDDYFKQAYISGRDEYTTHMLMVDGEIVFHRSLRFTFREREFVKGVGYQAEHRQIVRHCPHIDTFAAILKELEFAGLCCFNYKLTADSMKIFEINPRYGGSLTRFLPAMLKAYESRLRPE